MFRLFHCVAWIKNPGPTLDGIIRGAGVINLLTGPSHPPLARPLAREASIKIPTPPASSFVTAAPRRRNFSAAAGLSHHGLHTTTHTSCQIDCQPARTSRSCCRWHRFILVIWLLSLISSCCHSGMVIVIVCTIVAAECEDSMTHRKTRRPLATASRGRTTATSNGRKCPSLDVARRRETTPSSS